MTTIEPAWQTLLAQLLRDESRRSALVLGHTDSGKTTFSRYLGRELAQRWRTAAIDGDPGQSAIGLPTTLAMAWEPWDGGSPAALRFVGATTPVGHFLQTLTGLRRLQDRAVEEGAQRVVIDPPGYIDTDAGREFTFQMIDLLQPDDVVIIQRTGEMEAFLASLGRRRTRPFIHRLAVSSAVRPRTPAQRRAYRERKLKAYFQAARPQTLPLNGIGVHGMASQLDDPGGYRDLLAGLCDERGFAIVLGILEAVSRGGTCLEVYAPPFDPEKVVSVQIGSIRVARTGEHF